MLVYIHDLTEEQEDYLGWIYSLLAFYPQNIINDSVVTWDEIESDMKLISDVLATKKYDDLHRVNLNETKRYKVWFDKFDKEQRRNPMILP